MGRFQRQFSAKTIQRPRSALGFRPSDFALPAPIRFDLRRKRRFLTPDQNLMSPPKPTLDDLRIHRSDKPQSPSRFWFVAGVLLLLLAAGLAAWWFTRPKVLEVRTVLARAANSAGGERTVLNASGYVTARRAATVSAKITGKVTEVLIEEGMKVSEGQILARLDDTNVRASLKLAEAQLESAKNALAETRVRIREADQELLRQTNLVQNHIATQADYEHAEAAALALKAKLDQQQSEVLVAERTIATWQQQLEDTVIRAPFAGIVTSKNAQPGEMISPISAGGGFTRTGICTIVDMESLEIEIDVNESYINRVEPGQPVEAVLDAYPDWKIPCKVIAIIPTADRQKSTVKVRVGFDKLDRRILPEMSIKVAFHEAATAGQTATRAVLVPKSALQEQDGRNVVFVAQDGRVERRAITVATSDATDAVVTAGLAAGEKVVVDGPATLKDGMPIKEMASEKQ
jgi:HlyD family secretion protein